ncbi:MAG: hypothetical protein RLZZ162_2266 [Verrucomicrobiota bacterium]|jgi:2',3'-cyclic-nucleotide 2'-phosphodiesterase/3'-nucleotidase
MIARPVSRRSLLGSLLGGGAALSVLHPFAARAASGQVHLRLVETTDLHCAVYPFDYYADRTDDTQGLARTAALIDKVRAEAGNMILVDNGDLIQGNPLGDYASGWLPTAKHVHPMFAAMNLLGYEVSTLGNHEFNFGLDFLEAALAGANFPFVNANVVKGQTLAADPTRDQTLITPYRIVEKELIDGAGALNKIKIGFIGFVPPQIVEWDAANLSGKVLTRDIVETAKAFVPRMKEEGADLIVALAHTGIDGGGYSAGMENAALYVAGVPGVDVVMTGHQHHVFPGPDYASVRGADVVAGTLMGKPAVMAGFWGSHMGLIDLMLEQDERGWRIISHTSEARPTFRREKGQPVIPLVQSVLAVLESVAEDHHATLAYVRRPVGETKAPLFSYFALVADDPSVQIVSDSQLWYLKTMLKDGQYRDLPMLSAAAPFKAGGRAGPDYYTDVPAGPIAIRNVADLYLYPNTFRAVAVSGATVREWLERSAGIFKMVEPGKADQPLIDPSFQAFNFDIIDGVTYKIDLGQPSRYDEDGKLVAPDAHRIVNLQFAGKEIDPEARFIVATNNYRAGGGGHFPGVDPSAIVFTGPDTNRDIIVRYIQTKGTIDPSADSNWSFVPMPGTSIVFESGSRGREHLADMKGVKIEEVGPGESGFTRYRIAL